MGNSATKEQKAPTNRLSRSSDSRVPPSNTTTASSHPQPPQSSSSVLPFYSSQNGRNSRSDLTSLLAVGNVADRDTEGMENRRETRQEREARRLKREKIIREREREQSMKEEGVDGGFLVTQGVYTGLEDYNKLIVRQLMVGY